MFIFNIFIRTYMYRYMCVLVESQGGVVSLCECIALNINMIIMLLFRMICRRSVCDGGGRLVLL